MQYKSFTLDKFQEEAVNAIESNHSVVVSAPTGSGKTLIADYIINRDIKARKRVVYTAPIKALSNQKYRDFVADYGHENVGILTGDVVINPDGYILVMTTEVYRNMVMVKDPLIEHISYVVFDEIHFISDLDRGHIWEEAIIFSPEHIRFLCLSATIPNANQFAKWVQMIKKHQVMVVRHETRPVPLEHLHFDKDLGITTLAKIEKLQQRDRLPEYRSMYRRPREQMVIGPTHLELLSELFHRKEVPVIYFVFGRSATHIKAEQLSKKHDLLSPQERHQVVSFVQDALSNLNPDINKLDTTKQLRNMLARGIAVHHAGLLPQLKDIVEQLFGMGLVKVLYATETFAVGVNMPAKVVAFDSLRKFDGRGFRYLNSKEYFQLAGRAGRRGIDKVGKAVVLVNRRQDDINKMKKISLKDVEPLKSQFKLGYNTVLNMIHRYNQDVIDKILRSSFEFYQKYGPTAFTSTQNPYMGLFLKKKKFLEDHGYVNKDVLTSKGVFATNIFVHEVTFTEMFHESFHEQLSDYQVILLLASMMYEPKSHDEFDRDGLNDKAYNLVKMIKQDELLKKKVDTAVIEKLSQFVFSWYDGANFLDLMDQTSLLEGDIIRFFRQVVDVATQIKNATQDASLKDRLNRCVDVINRGFIVPMFEEF